MYYFRKLVEEILIEVGSDSDVESSEKDFESDDDDEVDATRMKPHPLTSRALASGATEMVAFVPRDIFIVFCFCSDSITQQQLLFIATAVRVRRTESVFVPLCCGVFALERQFGV